MKSVDSQPGLKMIARDAVDWHSRIAAEFEAKYLGSRAFGERLVVWADFIERYTRPDSVVLDAGCGGGILSFIAASHCGTVVGIDGSPEMIRICHDKQSRGRLQNVAFRVLRLEQVSALCESQFDLVLCSSVLEYVKDFWSMFDTLASCLRPGGVLLFSLPNNRSLYRLCERFAFALIRRPRYRSFVFNTPSYDAITAGLASRRIDLIEDQYYAAPPGLSWLAHRTIFPHLVENLIVFACRKGLAELAV
jgi:2-polyprenyl-3-methyl-5-hydroxy-6-metoxy-1,4-benzoquinol methylase